MSWNIIAIVILVVAIGGIIGVQLYKKHKAENVEINFDYIVNTYSAQIIKTLQDSISILQINIDSFEDREDYEKAIISTTIEMLKDNATSLGINKKILNAIDSETLTEIVYSVFKGNLVDIFSVINAKYIAENPNMYEKEVVVALSPAE